MSCMGLDFFQNCNLHFLQFYLFGINMALLCYDLYQGTICRLRCWHSHFDQNWFKKFLQTVRYFHMHLNSVLRKVYFLNSVTWPIWVVFWNLWAKAKKDKKLKMNSAGNSYKSKFSRYSIWICLSLIFRHSFYEILMKLLENFCSPLNRI